MKKNTLIKQVCPSVSRVHTLMPYMFAGLLSACGGGGGSTTPAAVGPTFTVVETITGQAGVIGSADGSGSVARLNYPVGLAATTPPNCTTCRPGDPTSPLWLYIVEAGGGIRLQQVNVVDNPVTTVFGSNGSAATVDGSKYAANVYMPIAITIGDAAKNSSYAYWTENGSQTVRKLINSPLDDSRLALTIAGMSGQAGSTDGTGTAARFNRPQGIVYNQSTGEIFVADNNNFTIRQLIETQSGTVVTTLAGQAGKQGTSDGVGTAAQFTSPQGMAMDSAGDLYVADFNCVRKIVITGNVQMRSAKVTTLAGLCGVGGYHDGTGSEARFGDTFSGINGLTIDPATADVYVTDSTYQNIRKITQAGVVTTVAGIAGTAGATDGALDVATFDGPTGIAFYNNQLFVADEQNFTIRRIR